MSTDRQIQPKEWPKPTGVVRAVRVILSATVLIEALLGLTSMVTQRDNILNDPVQIHIAMIQFAISALTTACLLMISLLLVGVSPSPLRLPNRLETYIAGYPGGLPLLSIAALVHILLLPVCGIIFHNAVSGILGGTVGAVVITATAMGMPLLGLNTVPLLDLIVSIRRRKRTGGSN